MKELVCGEGGGRGRGVVKVGLKVLSVAIGCLITPQDCHEKRSVEGGGWGGVIGR